MKSLDYREKVLLSKRFVPFLDSDYPFVYRQNVDLKDLQLIGYDKTSTLPLLGGGALKQKKTVHFFLDDYRYEDIWSAPEKQLKKLKQYMQVLGPDFSTYTLMPRIMQQYNVFRSRWCSAYWQQQGLAVIPTITWSDEESFEWCFQGVEKGSVIAIATVGTYAVQDEFMVAYKEMCRQIEPSKIINYGKVYEGMEDLADVLSMPYKYLHSDYNDDAYYEELANPDARIFDEGVE
jgi:hypothetical protein